MVNHYDLAKELFYQLALARFGGCGRGNVGVANNGIDVRPCIEQAMKMTEGAPSKKTSSQQSNESSTFTVEVSEAEVSQMVEVLERQRNMLAEYFSLNFSYDPSTKSLRLTSLPILLDDHSPPPHGLPLFLLRLATEIDYTDEKACFEGVCSELGMFYADLPVPAASQTSEDAAQFIDPEAAKYVKHNLHPALSYLLVPPKEFSADGSIKRMALLSSLYKVFERC